MAVPLALAIEALPRSAAKTRCARVDFLQDLIHGFARNIPGGADEMIALIGIHKPGGFEQTLLFALRYRQESVFVRMDQLPRADQAPKHLDLTSPAHRDGVTVPHREPAGQRFKTGVAHFTQSAPDVLVLS